jgi:hypothetical protein
MKRIFLMINEEAKRSYDQQMKMKRDRLDSAIKFCSQFVDITDEKEFSKGFIRYIDKKLREKVNIPGIATDKIFNLFDIPLDKIKNLESSFKAIRYDLFGEVPDFGIYAENERQVERLKKLQSLCDLLNDMQIKTDWLLIQRLFSQSILFVNDKWEPNVLTLSNY